MDDKIKIYYSIDDQPESWVRKIDSSFTIQQALQFIRDKEKDQDLQYVFIKGSIIKDLDDKICTWIDKDTIFNFRRSKILNDTISKSQQVLNSDESSSEVYEFTIYTTIDWISLTQGKKFNLKKNMNREEFDSLILDYCSIQSCIPVSEIKLFPFLPGGVEFINITLNEYIETAKPKHYNIYVVVTKSISLGLLSKVIVEICDIRGEMSTIFSPFTESTNSGMQLFACLLSSLYHQTPGRKEFIKSLSKITGFPPLITNLQALIDRKAINGKQLIIITSSLYTIFKYLLNDTVSDDKVLEKCSKLCNLISQIDNTAEVPIEAHSIDSISQTSDDSILTCIEQYMSLKRLNKLIYWKPDFDISPFQKTEISPFSQSQLQNAWEKRQRFKPVMPLNLLHVHASSIVYGPDNSYRVFTMETDSKEKETSSKVNLINPENGETTNNDIEEFAKNVKNKIVDNEKVELIDEESVQQITMVLIDQSGSMISLFDNSTNTFISRDFAAKYFLTSWASKSYGYRISSLQGLISFSTKVDVKLELSPLTQDFEKSVLDTKPYGMTPLWPAIKKAGEMLVDKQIDQETQKKKFKNAILRILILTDGVDVGSSINQYDVLPYLIEHGIIVDVVVFSNKIENNDVCVLAQLTGGLAFKPSTISEGISLFEKEAFLSISYREKPQPFTREITPEYFEALESDFKFDTEPKNKIINQARARKPLMTPRAAIKGLDGTSQSRLRRISKELRIIHQWKDCDVNVFTIENLVDRWRVFIKGPEGTPYENKWWDLFVTFPEKYPFSPPSIRFVTVPFHINISNEGRICMNTLGSDYSSTTSVMELIVNVKALLMLPNYKDPIDIAKYDLYKESEDHHEFIQKIQESVAKAKTDYNDYLDNIKIFDDQSYDIRQEPALHLFRCPISGVPLYPENTILSSSGIKYDRDALKRLLKSSTHPRCFITNDILTDDPDLL